MQLLRAQAIVSVTVDVVNLAIQRSHDPGFNFDAAPKKARRARSARSRTVIELPPPPRPAREDPAVLALSTNEVRFSAFAGETTEVPALLAAQIQERHWSLNLALVADFEAIGLPGSALWYRIAAGDVAAPFRRFAVLAHNNHVGVLAHRGSAAQALRIDFRMEVPKVLRGGTYRSYAVCSLYA